MNSRFLKWRESWAFRGAKLLKSFPLLIGRDTEVMHIWKKCRTTFYTSPRTDLLALPWQIFTIRILCLLLACKCKCWKERNSLWLCRSIAECSRGATLVACRHCLLVASSRNSRTCCSSGTWKKKIDDGCQQMLTRIPTDQIHSSGYTNKRSTMSPVSTEWVVFLVWVLGKFVRRARHHRVVIIGVTQTQPFKSDAGTK